MAYKPKRLQRGSFYTKIIEPLKDRNFRKKVILIGGIPFVIALSISSSADVGLLNANANPVNKELTSISVELDLKDYSSWNEIALERIEEQAKKEIRYGNEKDFPKQKINDVLMDEEIVAADEVVVEETEEEKYIKLYTDIYEVDYQKVYDKLYEMTDGFTDEAYLKDNIIGESKMKGLDILPESKEMAILIAVRSMYMLPNNYGFQYGELDTGVEYESDLDNSHQIAYVSRVLGVDPALNYAICRAECGFSSQMFLEKNNPSGIRFSGEWASFPSRTAGFIEQGCELLKYKIRGVTSIEGIGASHAPNSDPANNGWVYNVSSIYAEALNNYEELFGSEEEIMVLK